MKTILKLFLSLFATLFLISACSKDNQTGENKPPVPNDPPAVEPLTQTHTLIVFMQGDNGLEEFMDMNLQKIITAYYSVPQDLGRVVVFYDRGNYTRLTELYLDDGMAKQRLIQEYNTSQSTVDPQFMKEVFELIRQEAPAETYGLILSSHGGGWVPSDIYDLYLWLDTANEQPLAQRNFYGQDGYDCMELPQLAEALGDWCFEYVIFDACFMASVEGLYELRDISEYFIASSAEILGTGFPYEDIIPLLFSTADHSLKAACESYMDLYTESSGTISLIESSKLDELASVMAQIYAETPSKSIDVSSIQAYEGFSTHLYFDFEQYIEQLVEDEELLNRFREALAEVVIFTDHTLQFYTAAGQEGYVDLPRSCGLTSYIPQPGCTNTVEAYMQTSWAIDLNIE